MASPHPLIQKNYILYNSFPAKALPPIFLTREERSENLHLRTLIGYPVCVLTAVSFKLTTNEGGGHTALVYRESQKGKMETVGCEAGGHSYEKENEAPCGQPHEEISTHFTSNGFSPAWDTWLPGLSRWEHSPRGAGIVALTEPRFPELKLKVTKETRERCHCLIFLHPFSDFPAPPSTAA